MGTTTLPGLLFAVVAAVPSPEAAPTQSPGSVALLLLQPFDASVGERWVAALKDSRAEVRAAAARAINVGGARPLIEAVERALAEETDPDAAEEEILAAGALGGPAGVESILAAAQRLRVDVASVAAEVLARTGGVEALRHVPALRAAGLKNLDDMFRLAIKGGTDEFASAAGVVLDQNDGVAWTALLRLSREGGVPVDPAIIARTLTSESEGIRAATYWHLVVAKAAKGALPTETARSVEAALKVEPPKDPLGAFARELLSRLAGGKGVEQANWIAALKEKAVPLDRIRDMTSAPTAILDLLTPTEMRAVSLAQYGDPEALRKRLKERRSKPIPPSVEPPPKEALRTVDRFPPGFVAGVLAAAGCDPRAAHGLAGAALSYGADGRPRHVSIFEPSANEQPLGGPPPCQRAATALLVSSLAPRGHVANPETKETLLVLLDSPQMSCLAETQPLSPRRVSDEAEEDQPQKEGGEIRPPKKVTNVNPHYPEGALRSRTEGVVIVDATISPTGCVRSLALAKGVRALNWEAIRAVSQWRYTPTLLDGKPVPVLMTVTVNFRLR